MDNGSIVAMAFTKTPFSRFSSFESAWDKKYVTIMPPPAPKIPFIAPAIEPIKIWGEYFLKKLIKNFLFSEIKC